ncbi:MAG: hypothetical protein A3F74_18325 [Betaproteobacteria bacterium RIFCSPLOWO2_12_FULL_62_58]|nr:MAG: hypothetical protein A3F74_18325 [Betaproteobacteria bacterium RIFCSPLOWO2_12_FULL_62_58]
MLPDLELVDVSRLQFAVTAMYHFLFVPLTLGLSWILVIMESVYVMTGQHVYKDMTQFWGKLFGIGLALAFGIINVMWLEASYAFGELDEHKVKQRFKERSEDRAGEN